MGFFEFRELVFQFGARLLCFFHLFFQKLCGALGTLLSGLQILGQIKGCQFIRDLLRFDRVFVFKRKLERDSQKRRLIGTRRFYFGTDGSYTDRIFHHFHQGVRADLFSLFRIEVELLHQVQNFRTAHNLLADGLDSLVRIGSYRRRHQGIGHLLSFNQDDCLGFKNVR